MITVFLFIIGAIFGSFCSAILHRTRCGGTVLRGRSKCAACAHDLGAIDLVPVVSYLAHRGRCRFCRLPFSWQYLALELTMGGLFILAGLRVFAGLELYEVSLLTLANLARLMIFAIFLVLVFVYDARHSEVPDSYSVTGILVAIIFNILLSPEKWLMILLGSAIGAAFFGAQYLLGRGKWIGSGDIFLGAMMGAMCGWPLVAAAIFFSYLVGMIITFMLLATGKKKMSDSIPLGPFLMLGTAIVLFSPIGEWLMSYYAI